MFRIACLTNTPETNAFGLLFAFFIFSLQLCISATVFSYLSPLTHFRITL